MRVTDAAGNIGTGTSTITIDLTPPTLTINSQPLYTYAEDTAPGQTTGQNSGGTWFVVGADGSAIKS